MALSLDDHLLLLILPFLLLLLSSTTTSASYHYHHDHYDHHDHHLKSLHFSLYQHETINQIGYFIVNGVTGLGISQTTTPFSTPFAFHDPMTLTPNTTGKVVSTCQGTSITTSLDGLESISVAKITLNLKNRKGSISIPGVTHNIKPTDHPVVGGIEDFLFVQGYVTSLPVDLVGITITYKIEFHLYWPPYATSYKSLS